MIHAYRQKQMRALWNAIRRQMLLQKRGIKKFCQVVERMRYFDQAASFQKWQQYTICVEEKVVRSKKHGTCTFGLVIDRLIKRRQAFAIHQLRIRTQKKDFKEKYLKRMLQHCATYRMRHYFQKWHH